MSKAVTLKFKLASDFLRACYNAKLLIPAPAGFLSVSEMLSSSVQWKQAPSYPSIAYRLSHM
jgi:hypothetical protein